MYRHLLVTLDGTQRAESVIPHAMNVASAMRARVTLLKVVEPASSGWGERGALGRAPSTNARNTVAVEHAREYLERVAAQLAMSGIETSCVVREGPAPRQILETAADCDADVIAMATRSRHGLNKLVFGSVAEAVLHQSTLPVLLVRAA